MIENKTIPTNNNVYDFLNSLQNDLRKEDSLNMIKLMNKITNLEPVLWGTAIIGYGSYLQKYKSGRVSKAALLAFSPRKLNLVLYVLNNFEGQNELLSKLGKHKTGKICLYINKLSDINLKVLEEIITRSFNKVRLKSKNQ